MSRHSRVQRQQALGGGSGAFGPAISARAANALLPRCQEGLGIRRYETWLMADYDVQCSAANSLLGRAILGKKEQKKNR